MNDLPLRDALSQVIDGLILYVPAHHEEGDAKTSWQNLRWMLTVAADNVNVWPVDKTSRWVGFVQGVLAVRGILDVDGERDRTRPIFHQAYGAMALQIPPSQEMS